MPRYYNNDFFPPAPSPHRAWRATTRLLPRLTVAARQLHPLLQNFILGFDHTRFPEAGSAPASGLRSLEIGYNARLDLKNKKTQTVPEPALRPTPNAKPAVEAG
jgi:hypothetical protein